MGEEKIIASDLRFGLETGGSIGAGSENRSWRAERPGREGVARPEGDASTPDLDRSRAGARSGSGPDLCARSGAGVEAE